MTFTLNNALEAKQSGRLEDWIQQYLRSGDWANLGLADGLRLAPRWWLGPIETPLASLRRCCGPESDMQFQTPLDSWEQKINVLQDSFTAVENFPPVIAEYIEGRYIVRDGSHRCEAFRRLGLDSIWLIVWFNSQEEQEAKQGHWPNALRERGMTDGKIIKRFADPFGRNTR